MRTGNDGVDAFDQLSPSAPIFGAVRELDPRGPAPLVNQTTGGIHRRDPMQDNQRCRLVVTRRRPRPRTARLHVLQPTLPFNTASFFPGGIDHDRVNAAIVRLGRCSIEDRRRHVVVTDGWGEGILGAPVPDAKVIENGAFDRAGMKEPEGVHRPALSEAIDTADALFEAQWIPRQLDIDDEPAAVMQAQTFAGGIRRDQDVDPSLVERVDRRAPQLRRQAAMNACDTSSRSSERGHDRIERVAVLGEDDGALTGTIEESAQAIDLRAPLAARGQLDQALERRALFLGALESACRQHHIGLDLVGAIHFLPRQ